MTPESVLQFWYEELGEKDWFRKSDALDATIRERFGKLHGQAAACELAHWRETAKGRLAEIIVLDQFSRNMYRDAPRAFAQDPLALALAQEAIAQGGDQSLTTPERQFLYMPFMHSESAAIHQQAVEVFTRLNLPHTLEYELKHKAIIDRFGRYPHRNAVLGRASTPEEAEFLNQPGSSF